MTESSSPSQNNIQGILNLDSSWKGVYKAGGLSLFAGGAILIMFLLSVFIWRVSLPLTPIDVLENPVPPVTLYLLAAFGELLLVPGALGLYLSHKEIRKNRMLIAAALWLIGATMFLVSRGQIISLIPSSSGYKASNSEAVRAAYLVSTEMAIEAANMYGNMALMIFQAGSTIMGLVISKGALGKRAGYLVTVAGVLTLIGTMGVLLRPLAIFTLFGLLLTGVWQLLIGFRLYRLGAIQSPRSGVKP